MKDNLKSINDSAYKYLFKSKRIFLQLIQSFVYEDFVKDIKLENIDFFDQSLEDILFFDNKADVLKDPE